jgi:hypothetical protein
VASIAWSDVVAIAPQLATIPVAAQNAFLAYVNIEIDVVKVGGDLGEDSPRLRMARLYLAAHMGEMWRRKGQSGELTSENVGATAIAFTYGARNFDGDVLKTTSYGLEYERIMASRAALRMPITW